MTTCAYNAERHTERHFEALDFLGLLPASVKACAPGSDQEAAAVAAWQLDLGVHADGACGADTWAAARKTAPVPHGRAECEAIYGNPKFSPYPNPQTAMDRGRLLIDSQWRKDNIVVVHLHNGQTVYAHRLVADELAGLFEKACRASGYNPHCDGVLVPRRINWSSDVTADPSTHSYGIAVDFNAQKNGRGRTDTEMRAHRLFVATFEVMGWIWGGTFKTPDDMHFQRGSGV